MLTLDRHLARPLTEVFAPAVLAATMPVVIGVHAELARPTTSGATRLRPPARHWS
jgi:hypothetical protein